MFYGRRIARRGDCRETHLQVRVLLPVLVQDEQQLLRAAQGEHRDQARAAARHDALHGRRERLLAAQPEHDHNTTTHTRKHRSTHPQPSTFDNVPLVKYLCHGALSHALTWRAGRRCRRWTPRSSRPGARLGAPAHRTDAWCTNRYTHDAQHNKITSTCDKLRRLRGTCPPPESRCRS
jgi:hypothetical protein